MRTLEPASRDAIRRSFAPIHAQREAFAKQFYARLFALAPELRHYFPNDIEQQRRKFIDMLVVAVDAVDAPEAITPLLEELGMRHATYGTRPAHYVVLMEALVETLRASCGKDFDEATERAWRSLLAALAGAMLRGAGEA
ncbi:MAG TPA: globin domain-containing protein [Xanthomonadales bacterium]|nr:globin domain-containing protein [Xanthomonadales bacterium]